MISSRYFIDDEEIKFKNFVRNDCIERKGDSLEVNYKTNMSVEEDPGYLLPYDDRTFSQVVCIESSDREWELQHRIKEASKKVRSGGWVFVRMTPNDHKSLISTIGEEKFNSIIKYESITVIGKDEINFCVHVDA